jgi:hypothetical protein
MKEETSKRMRSLGLGEQILKDYVTERTLDLIEVVVNSTSLEEVHRAQGRIQELRYLLRVIEQAKENSQEA